MDFEMRIYPGLIGCVVVVRIAGMMYLLQVDYFIIIKDVIPFAGVSSILVSPL